MNKEFGIKTIEKMMNIVTAYTDTGIALGQCCLSSKNTTAEELLGYTRNHWKIESMHHILDVSYDEDRCKLLSKRAQENMNIFRKMGVSIHKNYLKDKKQTVKSNMFNCLLNDGHLLEILQNCNIS